MNTVEILVLLNGKEVDILQQPSVCRLNSLLDGGQQAELTYQLALDAPVDQKILEQFFGGGLRILFNDEVVFQGNCLDWHINRTDEGVRKLNLVVGGDLETCRRMAPAFRVYAKQPLRNIVRSVLSVDPFAPDDHDANQLVEYAIQRENPADFVRWLCADHGYAVFHTGIEVVARPFTASTNFARSWGGATEIGLGGSLVLSHATIKGYDYVRNQPTEGSSLHPISQHPVWRASRDAALEFCQSGVPFIGDASKERLDVVCRGVNAMTSDALAKAAGTTYDYSIKLGDVISFDIPAVDGLGEKKYRISRLSTVWSLESSYTEFEAIAADLPWCPDYRPRPSLPILPAVVTNVSDPDKLGRVRIRFGEGGRGESPWLRVAQPLGGVHGLPKVNQVVHVRQLPGGSDQDLIVLTGFYYGTHTNPYPENSTAITNGDASLFFGANGEAKLSGSTLELFGDRHTHIDTNGELHWLPA